MALDCIGTGIVEFGPTAACPGQQDGRCPLFECSSSSSGYQNDAYGWYGDARTTSGCGPRASYYERPIHALRLADDSGRFVEYTLTSSYAGRPLHSIVTGCMGSNRSNDGSSAWGNGHCTNVGTLTSSSGALWSGAQSLRIGVGDGGADDADWALLMPSSGNGGGDFQGRSVWAFGGEGATNNGHSGTVTIFGTQSAGTVTVSRITAENVSVVGFDTCGACGDAMLMRDDCAISPHTCDYRSGCEP